jgi:hypothetical protein
MRVSPARPLSPPSIDRPPIPTTGPEDAIRAVKLVKWYPKDQDVLAIASDKSHRFSLMYTNDFNLYSTNSLACSERISSSALQVLTFLSLICCRDTATIMIFKYGMSWIFPLCTTSSSSKLSSSFFILSFLQFILFKLKLCEE